MHELDGMSTIACASSGNLDGTLITVWAKKRPDSGYPRSTSLWSILQMIMKLIVAVAMFELFRMSISGQAVSYEL